VRVAVDPSRKRAAALATRLALCMALALEVAFRAPAAPAIASLDGEFSQSVASQLCVAVSAALGIGPKNGVAIRIAMLRQTSSRG
jgi:hypothetical protein